VYIIPKKGGVQWECAVRERGRAVGVLWEKGGVQWECAVRERGVCCGRAVGVCCKRKGACSGRVL
jgi:hypothetical protein